MRAMFCWSVYTYFRGHVSDPKAGILILMMDMIYGGDRLRSV